MNHLRTNNLIKRRMVLMKNMFQHAQWAPGRSSYIPGIAMTSILGRHKHMVKVTVSGVHNTVVA